MIEKGNALKRVNAALGQDLLKPVLKIEQQANSLAYLNPDGVIQKAVGVFLKAVNLANFKIKNFLSYNKIETQRFKLYIHYLELPNIMDHAIKVFAPRAAKK